MNKKRLLTIVCYDSILPKFTVLYCEGFVTYMAKMFSSFFAEKEGIPERWARQTHPAHPGWQSEHGIHFIMPGQAWVFGALDLQF